jgi:acetoin utilization deacetylase AcuC-like enzyme
MAQPYLFSPQRETLSLLSLIGGYRLKAFWDRQQLSHAPRFFLQRGQVRENYEVGARAESLLTGCEALGLDITMPPATERAALEAVHEPDYLDWLEGASACWSLMEDAGPEVVANVHPSPEMLANGGRPPRSVIGRAGWYSADAACPIGVGSWASIAAAAACAVAAADEAARNRDSYALCRPPGHHAYAARAGGHCYVNNAAVAVERLIGHGARRVAVLDIDSHHGNGTQGIFWTRSDVLFASIHGDPAGYYPWFVGHADEHGGGSGEGFTRNFPLAAGTGDLGWLAALDAALRAIERFGADALVVSLGFDASRDEPLNFLAVSPEGFARAGAAIGRLAVPAAFIQEGGYNTETLGSLLQTFLGAFRG